MFSYFFSGTKTTNTGSDVEMSPHIESDWVLVDDPAHSEEQPSQLYNIVPNGDVVIVLTHSVSCDDFISWPDSDRHTAKDAPALNEWLELVVPGTSDIDSMAGKGSPIKPSKGSQVSLVGGLQTSQSMPRTRLTRTDLGESSTLTNSSASESSDSSHHTWSTIAPALESTSSGANRAPQGPYEYRVSSSHLMAASPVFKDLLNNGEGLGKLRHTDGKIYFTARGVNEKALRILLKILNHQSGGLPLTLELSCLTMLSVLTSQLKCVQAVQWFGEHWCEKAEQKHRVPREAHLIAMMWLCISFIFKREDRFKEAAQVFLLYSEIDLLPTLGLPVEDALSKSYTHPVIVFPTLTFSHSGHLQQALRGIEGSHRVSLRMERHILRPHVCLPNRQAVLGNLRLDDGRPYFAGAANDRAGRSRSTPRIVRWVAHRGVVSAGVGVPRAQVEDARQADAQV